MIEEIKDETYFRLKEEYLSELKRLEQDSKQLTQWLDEARRNADFWCDKCTSLEQENKELKEENITAQKEYWKLEQGNDFLAEKVRLYRSALEEIRILATKNVSIENFVKIQNKINEVLNDN